jgi:hypothetical protein
MVQAIAARAPTMANSVLTLTKAIFNNGITLDIVGKNPAFTLSRNDAGGDEEDGERYLTREEITKLFQTMRDKNGVFASQNVHAVRLLLLLGVHKRELIEAPWSEFDRNGPAVPHC